MHCRIFRKKRRYNELQMKRSCTVHLVLDEKGTGSLYFMSIFVEDEPVGRGPFSSQPWTRLSSVFKQWGLDEAGVSALKKKLDQNQHAAREIEIEDSDLNVLGSIFNAKAAGV